MENNSLDNLKRGPGRPKGSKDRKWASIEFWYGLIENNIDALSPVNKVKLGQWGCELLVGKMKEIRNPAESTANVEETMKLLKEMEAGQSK